MKTTIWTTYHRDELVEEYGLAEDATHRLFATHHTPEGENVNFLNPCWSELTTMFYVWKNQIKSDVVGFEHYRRRLHVRRTPKRGECQVFTTMRFGHSVADQYVRCHLREDMDKAVAILNKRFGRDNMYSLYLRHSLTLIPNCCFLMRWPDFMDLCAWLFPILDEFAKAVGCERDVERWRARYVQAFGKDKATYQMRAPGFLAERLISAWIWCHLKFYTDRDVALVNYNTPELADAAIRSLNAHTPGCSITVWENSDERPLECDIENVKIIDNTRGQLVDFARMLQGRDLVPGDRSNYGSSKHSASIDALCDVLPGGFLLMDSDVLIRRDVGALWRSDVAAVGEVHRNPPGSVANIPRLLPVLCYLNVPMLRDGGIRYHNPERMWALTHQEPARWYDTGAWLLEEIQAKGIPLQRIMLSDYALHYDHGSWKTKTSDTPAHWLRLHRTFFE